MKIHPKNYNDESDVKHSISSINTGYAILFLKY